MTHTLKIQVDQPSYVLVYYVYILKCRTGHLYTGHTSNIKRRLAEHNKGTASKFTRSRLPVSLIYQERYKNRAHAMQREVEIKKMSRAKKIKMCKCITKDFPKQSHMPYDKIPSRIQTSRS
ncbi:MAG: GIY-YIG nuclease family protein [Nitrososphaerales archaeon]|nr:GIY-YIG nuclease family protein [Nitrososphaerales archaeon]